jgi:hypothetical protein
MPRKQTLQFFPVINNLLEMRLRTYPVFTSMYNPRSARNGSLKIFTTRQSGFQRFQKKLMTINSISVSLLTILK